MRFIALVSLVVLSACGRRPSAVRATPPVVPTAMERQIANARDLGDGDYDAKVLRARLDADPRDLKTRLDLARHYQKAGFPGIAIEHCRLACERAPESVEAHVTLARMLRADGKASEALAVLTAFAAQHESEAEVWAWLGLLHDETGDWQAGESAHRRAVDLAPARDDFHNNLGYCLLREGRATQAAEEFRAALRLNGQSVTARNNLGLALAANPAARPNEAVLNWQSVSDPASAHNNMAVALIEAGKYPEAREEIERALGYDRQHSAALNNLRLISQLDGKGTGVAPVQQPEGRLRRVRTAWARLWAISGTNDR
jgi:Flp pilus assembly protein TadD